MTALTLVNSLSYLFSQGSPQMNSHNTIPFTKVLAKQLGLPLVEAKGIVQSCPDCQDIVPTREGDS